VLRLPVLCLTSLRAVVNILAYPLRFNVYSMLVRGNTETTALTNRINYSRSTSRLLLYLSTVFLGHPQICFAAPIAVPMILVTVRLHCALLALRIVRDLSKGSSASCNLPADAKAIASTPYALPIGPRRAYRRIGEFLAFGARLQCRTQNLAPSWHCVVGNSLCSIYNRKTLGSPIRLRFKILCLT
jgi:hypothetical protein